MKKLMIVMLVMISMAAAAMTAACEEKVIECPKGSDRLTCEYKFYMGAQDYEMALYVAGLEIGISPESSWAHYYKARALHKIGDTDKAIQAYEKSLELKESNFYALNNAGLLYLQKGDLEKAREKLEKAVKLKDVKPYACNNLGATLERLGHKEKAAEAYAKALDMDPDYENAINNHARVTQAIQQEVAKALKKSEDKKL